MSKMDTCDANTNDAPIIEGKFILTFNPLVVLWVDPKVHACMTSMWTLVIPVNLTPSFGTPS
jgi:hypothetical protein